MDKKFYVTPEMEELEMKLQGIIAKSDGSVGEDPEWGSGDEVDEP